MNYFNEQKSKYNDLFYEWNNISSENYPAHIEINDETLRDGIQACGIKMPSRKEKIEIVRLMDQMGINAACIGFPATSPVIEKDIEEIITCIQTDKLKLNIACAARSVEKDIEPIIRLSQRFGIPIDANIFVGCSPIRQYVEEWDIQHILKLVKNSVSYAVKNNLPVCFITEDTTRSNPNDLGKIYQTAVECGAYRLCIADTVGYIIPQGVRNLIRFVKSVLVKCGKTILLDWHGHNDRGLALANALTALEEGVNRLHATALSIGERTGNTSMEQLLMNLKLLGLREFDSTKLRYYTILVSEACGFPIPINQPIVGDKAYTTATGVHAAAIIKAKKMNDDWLADRIYSSIPAQELGLNQKIEIGPMSGKANVKYFLEQNNINDPRLVDWILSKTKSKGESLTDGELSRIFEECGIKILYNQ